MLLIFSITNNFDTLQTEEYLTLVQQHSSTVAQ